MFVLTTLLILFEVSIAQQFCDQYRKNDFKVIIHSPDNENLVFIIEDKYWIINKVDNNSLEFKGNETKAHGSSELLSPTISTMFSLPGTKFEKVENGQKLQYDRIFAYYDPSKHNSKDFGIQVLGFTETDPFHPLCNFNDPNDTCPYYKKSDNMSIVNVTDTISGLFFVKDNNKTKIYYNIFVKQSEQYSNGQKIYDRIPKAVEITLKVDMIPMKLSFTLIDHNQQFIRIIINRIEHLARELPIIGFFITEDLVIMRSNSSIIYCSLSLLCPTDGRQVLIDCSRVRSSLPLYIVFGIFLLLFVIIVLYFGCVYCQRFCKKGKPHSVSSRHTLGSAIDNNKQKTSTVDTNKHTLDSGKPKNTGYTRDDSIVSEPSAVPTPARID